MEGCLLCLGINKELVGSIKVNSTKWHKLNIKHIIEKHLWIMESLLPSSWLCHSCWQTLHDFHKFYIRIEEVHLDYGQLIKAKVEPQTKVQKVVSFTEQYVNHEDNKDLFYSHLEPEILIDQLLIDNKAAIKVEPNEDVDEDNVPLIKRSTRLKSKDNKKYTEERNQDPLINCEQLKKSNKSKSIKKELCIQSNTTRIEINAEIETQEIKQDLDIIETQDISVKSPNFSDSDDNTYSDSDYEPEKESKLNTKKKRPRKNNTSDSNDSIIDSVRKPKTYAKKPQTQTSKNNTLFLDQNFKMSCDLCQIPLENFRALGKHFESEHQIRGYAVCCNKKFYKRVLLVEHVKLHVYPSIFKCEECGLELTSQRRLKTHQLLHAPEEEKKFSCSECGKTYPDQNSLSIHINYVHLKKYVRICDICGKSLGGGEVFIRHMLEHEGKSLPPVRCDICGLHLASKHGLSIHKRVQHPVGGKKDYICNICQKVSPNKHALKQHIRVIHTASSHKCTMCERVFKKPLALKEHLATHTGIALYTCPWCPKTFNANGGMHAHRKRQHPIEWEESRRQKILEKYKTLDVLDINNMNATDLKVDANSSFVAKSS